MTVRKLMIAAAILISTHATAQLVTVIEAVETSPTNIILPATTEGMVTFRPCAGECERPYKRVSLSAATRFTVNGRAVRFEDFRREFAIIKRAETSYALVSYETETNTLTSIQLAR